MMTPPPTLRQPRTSRPHIIAAGNPRKVIRDRFDKELTDYLLKLKWWDWDAGEIFRNLEALCSGDLECVWNIKREVTFMTGQVFLNWAIALLEHIETSPEKKQWCERYSVYSENPGQEELEHELHLLSDRSYRAGLVITNYHKVIELYDMDERQLSDPDAEKLSYLGVLACIAWHFRRDHFAEGSLIRESVANGVLLRLFRRLRGLKKGSYTVTTLGTLYSCNCSNIPDKPGIYRVIAPQGMEIQFTNSSANLSAPCYPAETLFKKYANCKEKNILYIGKANGRHGLRQRLRQYVQYGWNEAKNHKGGRAIWQIEDADMLLLEYECCADCEAREHQLLREYREKNGSYPMANWRG